MNLLQIGILIFIIIETLNVIILYFNPEFKFGNGVGVFNAYHDSKKDELMHSFVSYLINWVAGAKLIFIMIGIVVIIYGNYNTQLFTVVALILSILSFYFKLFPIIKKMDMENNITPKGYYKTLNLMILSFLFGFMIILAIVLI